MMINSRKITDLEPNVQVKCNEFIKKCKAAGIDILITSTYRDKESQAALYAIGRTLPGKKVTNAKPGWSWHNWRLAFDFVPLKNGKAIWNDAALFERCGEIAENCGLEWAGRWNSFKELAHCQLTGGKTLAQINERKK
jgi:peptidoglycan L-alanyl-D-glutamate endopeptidase CwlK